MSGVSKKINKTFQGLGKTAFYANQINDFFSKIYTVLTKTAKYSRKIAENTKTVKDISLKTRMTQGQILATQEGFAKSGINKEDTNSLLEAFVSAGQEKLFLTDKKNITNQMLDALKMVNDAKTQAEKEMLSKYFFDQTANWGSLVDIASKRNVEIAGNIGSGDINKNQKYYDRAFEASHQENVKEMINDIMFMVQQATGMHYKQKGSLLGLHNYEAKVRQQSIMKGIQHKDLTKVRAEGAIDNAYAIQDFIDGIITSISGKLTEKIKEFGGIDKFLGFVTQKVEGLIDKLFMLADILAKLTKSMQGFIDACKELLKAFGWMKDENKIKTEKGASLEEKIRVRRQGDKDLLQKLEDLRTSGKHKNFFDDFDLKQNVMGESYFKGNKWGGLKPGIIPLEVQNLINNRNKNYRELKALENKLLRQQKKNESQAHKPGIDHDQSVTKQ